MASKTGGGLIVGGLLVLFLGFIIGFDLVVDSEADTRATCDAADVGVSEENQTCDSTDRKFIGFQTLAFILVIFAAGIAMIWAGISKIRA
jgi:hypothetical protein